MSAELLPAIAKAASESGVLKEIYGDLAKPGVAQVGKALSTVLGLGNTILWPVQLLNERARLSLDTNLERYREKLSQIPDEKIIPVAPEVGVPTAEKLAYIQDVDLRELYTTLLAKASSIDTQNQAHPSFVNVINNLSPDEAKLLRQFKISAAIPFVTAQFTNPQNGHWMQIADLVFPLLPDVQIAFKGNLPAYISNLEGLGLLTVRRDVFVIPESLYEPIEAGLKNQFKELTPFPEYPVFTCIRGRIDLTNFGQLFIQACVE